MPVYGLIALNKDPMANGADTIFRGAIRWEGNRAWLRRVLQTV